MFITAEFKIKYNYGFPIVWLSFDKEINTKIINVFINIWTFKRDYQSHKVLYYPFEFSNCKVILNDYSKNL